MGECPNLLFQICSSKSLRRSLKWSFTGWGTIPPGPSIETTEALTSGGNGPESSGARNDGLGMLGSCVEWLKGKGILGTSRRHEKKRYDNFNPGFIFLTWRVMKGKKVDTVFFLQSYDIYNSLGFMAFRWSVILMNISKQVIRLLHMYQTFLEIIINPLRFGMPAAAPLRGMFRCFRLENPEVRMCCWRMLVSFFGGKTSNMLMFIPKLGEMIQFDEHMFQIKWVGSTTN